MAITMDNWVKANLGKYIDYDKVYGVQCVDLAKHFIKNVLGVEPQSIGNAIEYYNKRKTSKYLTSNFTWIDNTPSFVPQKGDICVFTSKTGNGHVSVATGEGTTSYFYSYDQNYPSSKGEPMTKIKHTYSSFLGVLRPKNQTNIKVAAKVEVKPAPKPVVKTVYYPKYTGKSASLVDAMKSLKIDTSMTNRKKIAKANAISNYVGLASQNTKMLNLLKQGKLIKA